MGAIEIIKNVNGIEIEPTTKEGILIKWENLGLLKDMPEEKKSKCAHIFEQIFKFLVNSEITNEHVENTVFPIVYRIVREVDVETEINFFDIITAVTNNMSDFNDMSEQEQYVQEGDFTVKITNIITERLKNK